MTEAAEPIEDEPIEDEPIEDEPIEDEPIEAERPATAAEFVLPLVIRLERDAPPTRTAALEAAVRAVLAMLTTDVAEWRPAVEAWNAGRIRKVVRRARGAEWRRAEALPGLTIDHDGAQVRVYPPIPLDGWPRDLARLQVGGTELVDPPSDVDPLLSAPPADRPVIMLAPGLTMTAGKAMAQVGHAAQLGWWASSPEQRQAWQDDDFATTVRPATPAEWSAALAAGAPVVHDAGFTEVAPNSATALFLRAAAG